MTPHSMSKIQKISGHLLTGARFLCRSAQADQAVTLVAGFRWRIQELAPVAVCFHVAV